MNSNRILLKTLLQSTSRMNILRHTTDRKKRRKIIGAYIGLVCIYGMLMVYSILMCIGYGEAGMIDAVPMICALLISGMAFILTIFKTNGYLFNFKEYDMLMSLPFEARTVAGCKFLYMYVKSLPWYGSISVAMLIGYGIYAHPQIPVYPVWVILSLILPIIPMLIASFLGFLIARVSSGFRKTNIVQTVLTMVFVIFCFSLRYIIDAVFQNDQVEQTLESISAMTDQAGRIYLPAGWFAGAVTGLRIADMLLLIGGTILLFTIVFRIVGSAYRNINSALKSHAAARKYRMTGQKVRDVRNAIAFKEFKRLTGSTLYMTNGALGLVLAALLGILTLVIGFDRVVSIATQEAPFDHAILQPAIPLIVYFFIGMLATTACSPSLEGRNYWILQSLPLAPKTIYQGKMLFNMYLTVPVMLFAELCLCISAGVPLGEMILDLILGVALCAFSTAWGCVCGIRHLRLDWENEVEVIKQGTAVTVYLLPNMFVVMGLCVLMVFLGMRMSHLLLTLILLGITVVLAILSYLRVMRLSEKK